jgi:hypothetical protein
MVMIVSSAQVQIGVGNSSGGGKTSFLGYTGHWSKTKKNTFVVDKDSLGHGSGTLTISPNGSLQTGSPDNVAWNKLVDDALESQKKYEESLNNVEDNLSVSTHHLNQILLADAKASEQNWKSYKIPSENDKQGIESVNTNSALPAIVKDCQDFKADYDEVINFYHKHKNDKDGDLAVPIPPVLTYECYACDSNLRKQNNNAVERYVQDFIKEEKELIGKANQIMNFLMRMGMDQFGVFRDDDYEQYFTHNSKNPAKAGACSYISPNELSKATQWLSIYLFLRAEKLLRQYRKDYKTFQAVDMTYMTARSILLQSEVEENTNDSFKELAEMVYENFYYYFGELKKHDYRQIGNLPFVFNLLREGEMLNGNEQNFEKNLPKIRDIMNGFTLSINMDIRIGKKGFDRSTHLQGTCKIGPDFVQEQGKCYRWVVLDDSKTDKLGIFKEKEEQQIDCDLITNLYAMPGLSDLKYVGTKKFNVALWTLNMDFCNSGKDSIILGPFLPVPKDATLWESSKGPQSLGTISSEYFEDVSAQKKAVDDGKAREDLEKYKESQKEQIAQLKALAEKMKTDAPSQKMADYQEMQVKIQHIKSSANAGAIPIMLFLDFPLPVQNNQETLVHTIFDAKKINPKNEPIVNHGFYTIDIVNLAGSKTITPISKK